MKEPCGICGDLVGTNLHYCIGDKREQAKEQNIAQFLLVLAKKDAEIKELREVTENCCKPAMAKLVELEKEHERFVQRAKEVIVFLECAVKLLTKA